MMPRLPDPTPLIWLAVVGVAAICAACALGGALLMMWMTEHVRVV